MTHLDVRQRVARPGESMWNWVKSFCASIVPRMVAAGAMDESEAAGALAMWGDFEAAGLFVSPPPLYELVAERAG